MAENLKTLKGRIRTSQSIAQIAKAMEMISASKIRRAKEAVEHNRPYAERIATMVGHALAVTDTVDFSDPLLRRNTAGTKLVVVLSPDRGLCGALPDNLARKLAEFDPKGVQVLTVGRKAEKFAVKAGYDLAASFPMGTKLPLYDAIFPLLKIINGSFREGKVSEVLMLYTEFRSMFAQVPVVKTLLPVPVSQEKGAKETPYTFEPSAASVLSELLPYFVEVEVYEALINAYTSEQAARMVSMQNAKNNAFDIAESITLAYNKLRQQKITSEILDITNTQCI